MNKVIFRKLHEDTEIPKQQTDFSACSDISAYLKNTLEISAYDQFNNSKTIPVINRIQTQYIDIPSKWRVLIPTGWAVKVPNDMSMRIYSRSGTVLKQGLVVANSVGIIDADYEFQVFMILVNTTETDVSVSHGDRIAQLDYVKNLHNSLDCVSVSKTDKEWFTPAISRTGGFGSTNK